MRTLCGTIFAVVAIAAGTVTAATSVALFVPDGVKTARLAAEEFASLWEKVADVLETMPEFSLNDSLARIHAAGPSNPDFETTLKRNASAWYCRSQIYEMIRFMVRRQFEALSRFLEDSMAEKDGFSNWSNRMRELEKQLDAQVEVFNARPLADMKPDCAAALGRLPKVLRGVAELQ